MSSDTKNIQALYDEWRAEAERTKELREEHYNSAAKRNDAYRALAESIEPGKEVTVRHDAGHEATITSQAYRHMPGHVIRISVDGVTEGKRVIHFGDSVEGEKITRRK